MTSVIYATEPSVEGGTEPGPERAAENATKPSAKRRHAATKATVAARKPATIPTVAANLLPGEVVAARRARKVRRAVIYAMVPVLAGLAGWYVFAMVLISQAERDLARAEEGIAFLQGQEQTYSEVTRTQAKSAKIVKQLNTVFSDDIAFAELFRPLQDVAPGGVTLTDMAASKSISRSGANRLPGTPGEELVGRITVAGNAPSKAVVASYVDALGTVRGVANPLLTNVGTTDRGVQFAVQMDITADAVGGRYTAENGKGAGR